MVPRPARAGRHLMAITANDPYYAGFTGTSAPYFESAAIPGQWDMHVINLDGAWTQFTSAPIVAAPIAIIDTGADVTHPELITPSGVPAPKIVRAYCYVTYPADSAQTSGPYVTDMDGHGSNVAGIADADTNNSFAFAGVAFDAPLLVYRIFPTSPSSGCEGQNAPAQCDTTSQDESSAINDAIAHGAKVINLSLGGSPPCSASDPEYIAVEHAIASGVVVVAAAGNGNTSGIGQPSLDCPAADPGVIAVGASALNDSNPLAITEYVAGYSNYLTTTGTSNGGAYLVAPGGDPTGSSDTDDLHWIENIYSSTAVQPGSCGKDFANENGDCRILIAGTSMAVPHVTGVVSLMLAKNPNLTPAQIATGLCASADNIGDSKQGCGRVNASAAVTWAATH
jgi:serine protease